MLGYTLLSNLAPITSLAAAPVTVAPSTSNVSSMDIAKLKASLAAQTAKQVEWQGGNIYSKLAPRYSSLPLPSAIPYPSLLTSHPPYSFPSPLPYCNPPSPLRIASIPSSSPSPTHHTPPLLPPLPVTIPHSPPISYPSPSFLPLTLHTSPSLPPPICNHPPYPLSLLNSFLPLTLRMPLTNCILKFLCSVEQSFTRVSHINIFYGKLNWDKNSSFELC